MKHPLCVNGLTNIIICPGSLPPSTIHFGWELERAKPSVGQNSSLRLQQLQSVCSYLSFSDFELLKGDWLIFVYWWERGGWGERFFPHRFFTLSNFLYPSFRQPSKVFDKRARHAWSSPSLFWPKCKQTHQTSCEALQTSVYTLLDDKRAFYFVAENLGRIYRKLWLSKVYFFVGKRNTLRFLASLG